MGKIRVTALPWVVQPFSGHTVSPVCAVTCKCSVVNTFINASIYFTPTFLLKMFVEMMIYAC